MILGRVELQVGLQDEEEGEGRVSFHPFFLRPKWSCVCVCSSRSTFPYRRSIAEGQASMNRRLQRSRSRSSMSSPLTAHNHEWRKWWASGATFTTPWWGTPSVACCRHTISLFCCREESSFTPFSQSKQLISHVQFIFFYSSTVITFEFTPSLAFLHFVHFIYL